MLEPDTFYEHLISDRERATESLDRFARIVSSKTFGADLPPLDDLETEKADYRNRIDVCNTELRAYDTDGRVAFFDGMGWNPQTVDFDKWLGTATRDTINQLGGNAQVGRLLGYEPAHKHPSGGAVAHREK